MQMKRVIQNAVIELVKEKQIDKISTTEIAKRAFISRITFYNYYANKYEVIESLLEEIIEGFKQIQKKNATFLLTIDMESKSEITERLLPNVLEITGYFYERKEVIEMLMNKNSDVELMDELYAVYFDHFIRVLPTIFYVKFSKRDLDYYASYMTKGVAIIIEKWFQEGFQQSVAFISESILKMLSDSLNSLYKNSKQI
ncbi:TetR/AcrR family transcriptional regulator [Enterococcus sp. CWB-B31]|uniref:TetR/AcrR family transcriptional regulator n=1 Tax=Enterococcus sp. CWB-B31 TaxID=2885159 RepID=UPI001E60DA89|nr:TetR/AcrR family transcriptional regulator [Enterococcus sp. CWB-B31]MCB5956372.1 TetR/AcrR family transcriptional regulator [Enterococcus sp. CWB-B31]